MVTRIISFIALISALSACGSTTQMAEPAGIHASDETENVQAVSAALHVNQIEGVERVYEYREKGEVLRIYDHIPEKRYINPFSASRNQTLQFRHGLHVFFDADGRLGSFRRYRNNAPDGIQVWWDPELSEHRGQIVRSQVTNQKREYPRIVVVRPARPGEVQEVLAEAEALRKEALARKQE